MKHDNETLPGGTQPMSQDQPLLQLRELRVDVAERHVQQPTADPINDFLTGFLFSGGQPAAQS